MTYARLSHNAGIPLRYANRHGLIIGPTGTGKSVSLMRLVEQFSRQGVPVFVADVKGDIGALSRSCRASFLDCFGERGSAVSVPFSAMGADLTARALDLSDTQAGGLELVFAYAAAARRRLDTIDNLRAVLQEVKAGKAEGFGTVSPASIGVIQRALLRVETQGGNAFFRAPCFDVARLLDSGLVSILQAETLIQRPRVYAAFLLWLLSELWQRLPEIGDGDKPRLVLFFDESHLLFSGLPAFLLQRIEQTVRLIRSKGVGVYFVSQSAGDIPAMVREQLAHRVTHDRAHGVGFAVVETIDATGRPLKPVKVRVSMPDCPLGALTAEERPPLAPSPVANGAQWETLQTGDILFLLLCITAVIVGGCLIYALGGKALFVVAAFVVAAILKKSAAT